jgi:YbbR domain-containing protein
MATSAWLWVQSQEVATARVRVQLDFDFAPNLITVDPVLSGATLIVEGTRAAMRRAERADLSIQVDLAQESVGVLDVPLAGLKVDGLPMGVDIVAYSPEVLRLRLDEQARRHVAVRADLVGEPADDHAIMDHRVTPDVVEVVGPRMVLDDLDSVRTKPIDVSGWSDSREFEVELDLPRQCRSVKPWEGMASVEVESLTSVITLTGVQVLVREQYDWVPAPENRSISLRLTGPTKLLRSVRARDVFAMVEIPQDPTETSYLAAFEANAAPRLEIAHPWPGRLRLAETPSPVKVVRKDEVRN